MAEGNKFLFEGGSLKGWTAGSWRDNLTVFEMLRDLFVAKEVPPQLIARYDIELDRWRSHENKTDIH
jgi:hypothetical protein